MGQNDLINRRTQYCMWIREMIQDNNTKVFKTMVKEPPILAAEVEAELHYVKKGKTPRPKSNMEETKAVSSSLRT